MKAAMFIALFAGLVVGSHGTVVPASHIAFDDFAENDVAAEVIHEDADTANFEVAAAFNEAASRIVVNTMEEPAPTPEVELGAEPAPMITTMAVESVSQEGLMESPEEVAEPSAEPDMAVSFRMETVMESPEEAVMESLEPEIQIAFRMEEPMESPNEQVEPSAELELLDFGPI